MRQFIRRAMQLFLCIMIALTGIAVFAEHAPMFPEAMQAPVKTPERKEQPLKYAVLVRRVEDASVLAALETREQAQTLLTRLLKQYASVPEGETLQDVVFPYLIELEPALYKEQQTVEEAFLDISQSLSGVRTRTIAAVQSPIAFETKTQQDPRLPKGTRFIVQMGREGIHETTAQIVYVDGNKISEQTAFDGVLVAPVDESILVGSYQNNSGSIGRNEGEQGPDIGAIDLKWPVEGEAKLLSNFGIVEGDMHYGVDIAGDVDDWIVAPGDGVVVYAKERDSYRGVVEIDHGNGVVTRMSDCGEIVVELGQTVQQGDVIAIIAPHIEEDEQTESQPYVHLELLINGLAYNPRFYI